MMTTVDEALGLHQWLTEDAEEASEIRLLLRTPKKRARYACSCLAARCFPFASTISNAAAVWPLLADAVEKGF